MVRLPAKSASANIPPYIFGHTKERDAVVDPAMIAIKLPRKPLQVLT